MADAINTTLQPSAVVESTTPRSSLSAGDVGQPYAMLARSLDKLGEGLEKLSVPFGEQAGHEAVSTDDQGNITMTRSRLPIFGEAGVAYSRAFKFSALTESIGAARRKDIEMSREYANDPEAYLHAATQFRSSLVQKVTAQAGPDVGEALGRAVDETTTFNYRRITGEQAAIIRRNLAENTKYAIETNRADALGLIADGALETPEGRKKVEDKLKEVDHAIQERRNPILGMPESESDRIHTDLRRDIDSAKFDRELTKTLTRPGAAYDADIEAAANKWGYDRTFLTRQLYKESAFDERAVSPKGAKGIAQFMDATARQYGVDVFNAQSSINGAAHMMSDLQTKYHGNTGLALAAYNWGEGHVAAWMASGANPSAMPDATRKYIEGITGQSIEGWLRGERPSSLSVQSLPQQYEAHNGIQNALAMVEAMRNDQSIDPVQRQLNFERGTNVIKQFTLDQDRQHRLAEQAQKARDEDFMNKVVVDSAQEKSGITDYDIKTAQGISAAAKERALAWRKRDGKEEPAKEVSAQIAVDLIRRIRLPDGDPRKITSAEQIRDVYAPPDESKSKLLYEDWQRVEKMFVDTKTPEGSALAGARKAFFERFASTIDAGITELGEHSELGSQNRYRAESDAQHMEEVLKKQGKDPMLVYRPGNENYFGRPENIEQYHASLQDIQKYQAHLRAVPPGATFTERFGNLPPAKPGTIAIGPETAKLAPDGNYYVERGGKFFRVDYGK